MTEPEPLPRPSCSPHKVCRYDVVFIKATPGLIDLYTSMLFCSSDTCDGSEIVGGGAVSARATDESLLSCQNRPRLYKRAVAPTAIRAEAKANKSICRAER